MSRSRLPIVFCSLVFAFLFSSLTFADRVITTNGKILEGKVTQEGENYKVDIQGAILTLPKALVKELEIEGDMSTYVPKDDREKEMLTKGFVKYKGQWMSKDRYISDKKKEQEISKKKLEDIKLHQIWGNEWRKETKHFYVHCSVSPELLDEYCEKFEYFYDQYVAKFHIKLSPAAAKEKMTLNIFKDRADYVEYSKKPTTGGYFAPGEKSLYLYQDHDDPFMSQVVLFHEGTHMINYMVNPEMFGVIPIWLEESTAEYFSHVKIEGSGSKRKIMPGEIAEDRLGVAQELILQDSKTDWLQKVFTTPQVNFHAELYSLGWSFVHFLFNTPKYSAGFHKFYEDIYQARGLKFERESSGQKKLSITNEEVVKGLLKYIGVSDIKALDAEWRAYVKALKPPGGRGYYYRAMLARWEAPSKSKGDATTVVEATDALSLLNKAIDELSYKVSQAYFLRAQVNFGYRNVEKAMADLKQAIEIDPTNDRFYVFHARIMFLKKNYTEAENDLKIAMAIDPENSEYEEILDGIKERKWKRSAMED